MPNAGCETLLRGDSPVLVVTPHTGTALPDALRQHAAWLPVEGRLADPAGLLFQEAARRCGATLIGARYHPCVIDFMVSAQGPALSVDADRGGLCRTHTSRGESLYDADKPLTASEVDHRVEQLWRPFHRAVTDEIRRLRARHDHVLMLVPHASWWLSPFRAESMGRDCSIGTDHGKSCDRALVGALTESATVQGRSWVVNGNIADGFTAEHYGDPRAGLHVMNVEISGQWRIDCASEIDRAFEEPLESNALPAPRETNKRVTDTMLVPLLDRLERVLRSLPAVACTYGANDAEGAEGAQGGRNRGARQI
ncbi:N-formylglutamate amidohydrolase [Paraburkholderia sp. HD33-4]|uniref:N-formylglutamate amidohydrolase n=1 Tax=Paraburkholderia sp. HD33-4 TaxID=2883242 RepID=UPI001F29B611|nr:N-formylglutamate amidohydrolase [Paraburkholderia sp. HD33-4]